jgi:hypothetical protein
VLLELRDQDERSGGIIFASMESVEGVVHMPLMQLPTVRGLVETCHDPVFLAHADETILPVLLANFADRAFGMYIV